MEDIKIKLDLSDMPGGINVVRLSKEAQNVVRKHQLKTGFPGAAIVNQIIIQSADHIKFTVGGDD